MSDNIEKKIGFIEMSSEGLRKLAKGMDLIYPNQIISLPVWKYKDRIYFQLAQGSGEIKLK